MTMDQSIYAALDAAKQEKSDSAVLVEAGAGAFLNDEGFTTVQAINEAKRCLHCKVPQCVKGCPIDRKSVV